MVRCCFLNILIVITVLTTWTMVRIECMKFGMIFNVANGKADLMITEDSDIDVMKDKNSTIHQVEKPTKRRRKKTTTTTTTTEEPWQEIDETRTGGGIIRHGGGNNKTGGPLILLPPLNHRYIAGFHSFQTVKKPKSTITVTTTVLSEVKTKTEIVYPTCLALTTPIYHHLCEQQKSLGSLSTEDSSSTEIDIKPTKIVESTVTTQQQTVLPPADHQPNHDGGGNGNNNDDDNGDNTDQDQYDIARPTETINYFSTSLWLPDEYVDNDDVQSSFIELSPYDDLEAAERVWRRSTVLQQTDSMISTSSPLQSPIVRKVTTDDLSDTLFHTEIIAVTKVERYTDRFTTVTVLSDGCSTSTPEFFSELPLCQPVIYPTNVPFTKQSLVPTLQSAIDSTVNNVYRVVLNQTMQQQYQQQLPHRDTVQKIKEDGHYQVQEITTPELHQVGEHIDESAEVKAGSV